MSDQPSYTCPFCERTSYNAKDVEHSYCGACNLDRDEAEASLLRQGVAAGVAMLAIDRVCLVLNNRTAREQALRSAANTIRVIMGEMVPAIDEPPRIAAYRVAMTEIWEKKRDEPR